MAGSSFGTIFRLTTWGESHGKGVGVVVDGVPAGLSLSEEDIQFYLDRRKPGQNRFTTKRKESAWGGWNGSKEWFFISGFREGEDHCIGCKTGFGGSGCGRAGDRKAWKN